MTQNGEEWKGWYRCTTQRFSRGMVADRLHADCVPSSRRCAQCLPCPEAPQSLRRMRIKGRSSPHPFIARIPLTFAFLLPLLIALLLFLLLGTAPLPVVALFLIHLALVGGGLVDV
jgi:hypothetical protein